jgi:hypothetical protein
MSRDVHSCTVLSGWDPATPPCPPIWTRITRALLVSKDRRHLFVTPCPRWSMDISFKDDVTVIHLPRSLWMSGDSQRILISKRRNYESMSLMRGSPTVRHVLQLSYSISFQRASSSRKELEKKAKASRSKKLSKYSWKCVSPYHKVHIYIPRVPQCLSSRPNFAPPPHPICCRRVCPSPQNQRGDTHACG